MKRCKHCGAPQQDWRSTCIDCGKILGHALSKEEEQACADALDDRLTQLSERTDAFVVSRFDRVLGILSIIGAFTALVLFVINQTDYNQLCDAQTEALLASVLGGADGPAVQVPAFPHSAEQLQRIIQTSAIALVCYVAAIPFLLFPRLTWYIDTHHYRLHYRRTPAPTDTSILLYDIIKYGSTLIGTPALIYAVYLFFT